MTVSEVLERIPKMVFDSAKPVIEKGETLSPYLLCVGVIDGAVNVARIPADEFMRDEVGKNRLGFAMEQIMKLPITKAVVLVSEAWTAAYQENNDLALCERPDRQETVIVSMMISGQAPQLRSFPITRSPNGLLWTDGNARDVFGRFAVDGTEHIRH